MFVCSSVHKTTVGVERKKLKSTKVASVRQGSKVTAVTTSVAADSDLQAVVTLQQQQTGHHRHQALSTGGVAATNNGGSVRSRSSMEQAMQRCGICSLLSRLLRRAMCVGSRRGSGESYYQELAETNVSVNVLTFFLLLKIFKYFLAFCYYCEQIT